MPEKRPLPFGILPGDQHDRRRQKRRLAQNLFSWIDPVSRRDSDRVFRAGLTFLALLALALFLLVLASSALSLLGLERFVGGAGFDVDEAGRERCLW